MWACKLGVRDRQVGKTAARLCRILVEAAMAVMLVVLSAFVADEVRIEILESAGAVDVEAIGVGGVEAAIVSVADLVAVVGSVVHHFLLVDYDIYGSLIDRDH